MQYLEDNKLTVLLNTEESIFLWIGSEILSEKQMILIGLLVIAFIAFLVVVNLLDNKSLNGIKAKKSRQRTARNSSVGNKSRSQSDFYLSAIRA